MIDGEALPVWLDKVAGPVLSATGAPATDRLTGELLRQWGSSEVWRLTHADRSVIVKRGRDTQAAEAEIYRRLVQPLDLPAPALLAAEVHDDTAYLVLDDVGNENLEDRPSPDGFVAGVRLLAQIRAHRVDGPSEFERAQLLDLAARAQAGIGPETALDRVDRVAAALDQLHRDAPLGVVHGDFAAKNLVGNSLAGESRRWTLVDWPAAHVAPHLADLHTWCQDAERFGVDPSALIEEYATVSGTGGELVRRQLLVGAACFSVQAVCWIVEEGTRTVPESQNWVAGLLADLADAEEALG